MHNFNKILDEKKEEIIAIAAAKKKIIKKWQMLINLIWIHHLLFIE